MFNSRLILVGALSLLVGCASMSKEECQTANWELIGFSDAAKGRGKSRVGDHAEACSEAGVRVDMAQYMNGYDRGLGDYCTLSKGFNVGEKGRGFPSQCSRDRFPGMTKGYAQGKKAHSVNQQKARVNRDIKDKNKQIDSLTGSISDARKKLENPALPRSERFRIRNELEALTQLTRDLQRQILQLEDRAKSLTQKRNALAAELY